MGRPTYIIPRSTIQAFFSMDDYLAVVENAFAMHGRGQTQMPPKLYTTFPKGDLRSMPAYLPTLNAAGVKNVNVHPGNTSLPAVMATITLIDPDTGFPLAVMDGTHITSMRTGAAGGIAAKYLARDDSSIAAFVGCGAQARTQLEALMRTRPALKELRFYDAREQARDALVQHAWNSYKRITAATTTIEHAVRGADIIITTTPSRKPLVMREWVKDGAHINAIGADAPGKEELDPAILQSGVIVIDDWEQASHSGEINVPLAAGVITRESVRGSIGEVIASIKPGRTAPEQITIFDSTGLAIQDIASAHHIYTKLTTDIELEQLLEKTELF